LLTLAWLLTTAALLIAATALVRARRTSRRLERLTESYWEVRYEVAQLRARVSRLEPAADHAETVEAPSGHPGGATAFVPLSSLKRSS
jgi:type II secretory pathway component PulJ